MVLPDQQAIVEACEDAGVHPSEVDGFVSAQRFRLSHQKPETSGYLAIYEMDAANVMDSPAWLKASEIGDWAPKIRPHTTNRSHTVMRKIA